MLSGVSPDAYWAACLFFDLTLLATPFILFTIVVASTGTLWLAGDAAGAFVLLFVLGILGIMPLLYLLSLTAQPGDEGNGSRNVGLPFLMTYLVFEGMFIIPQFAPDIDDAAVLVLEHLAQLQPAVALGAGFTAIVSNSVSENPTSSFEWNVATRSLVFLLAEFAVFFGILLHLEHTDNSAADTYVCTHACVTCLVECVGGRWSSHLRRRQQFFLHSPLAILLLLLLLLLLCCWFFWLCLLCVCVFFFFRLLFRFGRTGGSCGRQPLIVEHPSIEDDDVRRERERVTQSEEMLLQVAEQPKVAEQAAMQEMQEVQEVQGLAQTSEEGGECGRGILRFVNVRKVFGPKQRGGPANVAVSDLCLDVYV